MILPAGDTRYYAKIHSASIKKPILFMLHGFMGSGRVFDHLIEPLKKQFTPVTIDLAGHGKTTTPPDDSHFSADIQTAQLKSVFKRFRSESSYLYGYSMGGRLALQFAARYPEMLKGVCIESAHCGIQDADERAERKRKDFAAAEQIEIEPGDFLSAWSDLPLFATTPEPFREKYHHISENQNPKCMAASLRGFGAGVMPVLCNELKNIKIPVQYLAGETDSKYVQIMKNMHDQTPGSRLITAPGSGHRVHTDQPEDVLQALYALREHSGKNETI